MFRASVAELADAPDLGSGGFTVGVQVPSPALYQFHIYAEVAQW